jgi:PleD family two-component response regulator
MGTLGLVGLSPDQRRQKTREKMAFDVRAASIAKTTARQDQMTFMSDDADAHLSAFGTTLTKMDASEAKTLAEMNTQLAENDFVQGQMEARQDMDRLDLYAQILLAKASAYNRGALASHLAVQPLLVLSEALEGKRGKP